MARHSGYGQRSVVHKQKGLSQNEYFMYKFRFIGELHRTSVGEGH